MREQGGVRGALESSVNDMRDIHRDIQYMEAKRHNFSRRHGNTAVPTWVLIFLLNPYVV